MDNDIIANVLAEFDNVFVRLDTLPVDVPPEVAVMFRGRSDVTELWKFGHDAESWSIATALRNSVTEFIAAPSRFRINGDGTIQIEYPNKQYVITKLQNFGNNVDEILTALRSYHHVIVNSKPTIKIIRRTEDEKTATELIKRIGVLPSLCLVFGVKPSAESFLVYAPRFCVLFKHPTITPPVYNVFQMTYPNSGKSYYAIALSMTFQYEYFTSMPTPARLVFDASLRQYGAVFTKNGLVFDEVDKWRTTERENFRRTYSILLSGMENGVWTRESSRFYLTDKVVYVPVLMFTNITFKTFGDEEPRERLIKIVAEWGGENPHAFAERFTIVHKCEIEYNITDNITGYTCVPSVRRGLKNVIQKLLNEYSRTKVPETELRGRQKREYVKLYPLLRLFFPINDNALAKLTERFTNLQFDIDEFENYIFDNIDNNIDNEIRERAIKLASK